MPRERDEESGKFTDAYGDEDFLEAIREHDGLAGTTEIAETVGCTRRHALNRLHELEDSRKVTSRDVGRSLVWILAEGGDDETEQW